MWSPPSGYDRSTTMYSPQGRIIQTEYAREAMRRGSLSIGIKSSAGVVLAGHIRTSELDIPNPKIAKIDDNFASIFAGFAADGRVLINRARVEAQVHKMTYSEPADIKYIATKLADYAHMFTQQGGLRPLGIGLLLGGIDFDGEPRIYFVNPGGGLFETKAKAVGSGDIQAMEFLIANYKDDLSLNELIKLAKQTISNAVAKDEGSDSFDPEKDIELWYIESGSENIPTVESVY